MMAFIYQDGLRPIVMKMTIDFDSIEKNNDLLLMIFWKGSTLITKGKMVFNVIYNGRINKV